jgi:hypothetical protein
VELLVLLEQREHLAAVVQQEPEARLERLEQMDHLEQVDLLEVAEHLDLLPQTWLQVHFNSAMEAE